jgi:hypothetical protein
MADFIGDAVGGIVGNILGDIVLKPINWILWATGVAAATAGSFGRFQIEPFNDDEWLPEEAGPILSTFGATLIGSGFWIIAVAALLRELVL